MKNMNLKIASLLLSAVLTAACAPQMCLAADTPAFTAADIVKQLDEPDVWQYDDTANTATETHDWGIAFTWHGEGKPTKIGKYQLTWSDGAYGSLPGTVQPAAAFGEIVGHLDETGFPWDIKITNTVSDELKNAPETVYMVNACDSETIVDDKGTRTVCTYDGIAEALMNDPNVEIKGLIRVKTTYPTEMNGECIMDWVSRDYLTELVPITQNTAMNRTDMLFRQVNSITRTQKPVYEAKKPADGDVVAYYNSEQFRGIVCRCADHAQYGNAENSPLRLLELADFLETYSIGDDELHLTMEDVKIPDNLSGETLFILSAEQDEMKQFLADHPDVEPVGILVSHIRQRSHYDTTTYFWLEPAEGKNINAAALEKEYGIHYTADDWSAKTNSLEEAAALCEKLEARDDIKFAWLSGTRLGILQGSDFDGMEIVPLIDSYLAGDVNSDGAVELADALTALQTYSDVELMNQPNTLTAAQFIAADMDGDGKVTIGDALTILQIYTDETLFEQ